MARSPFVPVEERVPVTPPKQGARGDQQEVLPVHSQVRRIKEDEETRERLLKLQLLEIRKLVARRAMQRSLSPLQRAGNTVPVGD